MVEQNESLDVMIGDLLRVAVKRRWWLLVPTAAVALVAGAVSMMLPNQYRSEATILVTHQQVPERYVTPNSTSDIHEALLLMTDAILSRSQLLEIIKEFNLYPQARARMAPEDLVELIQKNIAIEPTQKGAENSDLNSFKISFTASDPHVAQDVTTKLTTLFKYENLKTREDQSTGTTNFLEDQLQLAAADLEQRESRVRDFKLRYLGQLPEQQQGNLGILSGLQMQLQNISTSLSRAREQRAYLQSLLTQYEELTPAVVVAQPGGPAVDPAESIRTELARLRSERLGLLARYTEKYPDVVKIDEQIKSSEALLAAATKKAPKAPAEGDAKENTEPGDSATNNATNAQLKSQLQANRIEIDNDVASQKQLEARIADYQGRLNMTPVREQELADLLRGYNLSKQNYDDLLSKKTQSELATNLERRQQGQQFRIIDPPSFPMKPTGAVRAKIRLGGLGAGLALGLVLAFLIETKDHSLRDEQELRRLFSFPLMVGLPTLPTKAESRRHSRSQIFEWLVGTTLCLLVCATEFYLFTRG
ncbi:MAG: XrtA system polysaccharide chain length determinant [Terriglobia bacterium]